MGASLPAAARWIETNREGVSWMGLLYGAQHRRARFSAACWPGFYLLRVFDMGTATFVAAALNVACRAGQPAARRANAASAPPAASQWHDRATGEPGYWPVYVAIALSGATALGAEVIWTRLLGLMLGATVYTFSIILAVFLVGLGLGSAAGSLLARAVRPRLALGLLPIAAGRRHRLDRLHARRFPAVLADQSAALHQVLVHLPDRPGALPLGHPAGRRFCGARAFRWRWRPPPRATRIPRSLVGGIYAANTGGRDPRRAELQR